MTSGWTTSSLTELAEGWFEEIRSVNSPSDVEESFGGKVTDMSFFAPAEAQWEFLQVAVDMAENKDEFGFVAAFSFEQFMSTHGEAYIDEVERLSSENEKFKSVVESSWRHMMNRKMWRRIQAIQGVKPDPFWKFW